MMIQLSDEAMKQMRKETREWMKKYSRRGGWVFATDIKDEGDRKMKVYVLKCFKESCQHTFAVRGLEEEDVLRCPKCDDYEHVSMYVGNVPLVDKVKIRLKEEQK